MSLMAVNVLIIFIGLFGKFVTFAVNVDIKVLKVVLQIHSIIKLF